MQYVSPGCVQEHRISSWHMLQGPPSNPGGGCRRSRKFFPPICHRRNYEKQGQHFGTAFGSWWGLKKKSRTVPNSLSTPVAFTVISCHFCCAKPQLTHLSKLPGNQNESTLFTGKSSQTVQFSYVGCLWTGNLSFFPCFHLPIGFSTSSFPTG